MSFAFANDRVLIFGQTIRAAHADIIPIAGNALVQTLIQLKTSATLILDSAHLDQISLNNYDVIIMLDVSEKVLSEHAKKAIEKFVQNGGGLVAIHSSIGAARDWAWLQKLFGVQFVDHPPLQEGRVSILKPNKIIKTFKIQEWSQTDEWYNFSGSIEPSSAVVMTVETKDKIVRPTAWSRTVGQGRFFYIAAGHSASLYSDSQSGFMQTLVSATKWAASAASH